MVDGRSIEALDIEYGDKGIRFPIEGKELRTRFVPYAAMLYVDHFE